MTAQEMFEELGFRKNKGVCYTGQHILYEKPIMNETDIFIVEFKDGYVLYTDSCYRCIKIRPKLIKAIYQQMKELEWLKSND